ncbi:MAG: four helix bundle protein [Salibacteraceae bacterium]
MRDFRKYKVWQESFSIVKEVYRLMESLPQNERYGLASQMGRAAVSIPSNISEGCSRSSDIEFKRFLEIAMGSAFELETQLMLCQEMTFIDPEQAYATIEKLQRVEASLNALIQKIKTKL